MKAPLISRKCLMCEHCELHEDVENYHFLSRSKSYNQYLKAQTFHDRSLQKVKMTIYL